MRILSSSEIKAVEEKAFEKYTTESDLMYKAGEMCFNKTVKQFPDIASKTIGIYCGNGKNAGDGFVMAKLFSDIGADVYIVICDKMPTIAEPKQYYDEAVNAGVPIFRYGDELKKADYIIDCMFGIGFKGSPRPPFDMIFDDVNESGATVIAVDTPSGTNSTDGSVIKAVKADFTIAISTLKYAHVLPPSNEYCSKIAVGNIGIPEDCYDNTYAQTISKSDVKKMFPSRNKNSNKGTFGRQLNICGSYSCPGAAVMCAFGGLKTGAGLVKCLFPKSIYPALTAHLYESVFIPVTENTDKTLSMGALSAVLDEVNTSSSVVIGPGIGVNDDTEVIVNQVIRESKKPIVIDADGINCLKSGIDILQEKKAPVIITPHPGEMARLLDKTISEVQENRVNTAQDFAKKYGVIVVLKGANTVVTDGERVYINTTGNPGMAMGGTGDLLAGMIGSFLAQGMDALDAARAAVFIHGMCGDVCRRELSLRGMTVSDMIFALGALMSEFE